MSIVNLKIIVMKSNSRHANAKARPERDNVCGEDATVHMLVSDG